MPDEPEPRLEEHFECRICWTEYEEFENAAFCCSPVRHSFECNQCGEDFESIEEAAKHVHGHALQDGKPTLGEWATKIEVEREIECQTG